MMRRVAQLTTLASILYSSHCFVVPVSNGNTRHSTLPLAGLLDEYLISEGDNKLLPKEQAVAIAKDPPVTTESDSLQQYEDLFHSLIFSGDTRADVARQLEQCTDSKFAEYLQTTLDQSQDEDEKEGLQELMDMIAQVVVEEKELKEQQKMEELNSKDEAAKAERQAELEKEANENKVAASTSSATQSSMSNVDVLKQANAIDEAVMTNVMSDDEKPSDFISDCREVVNLSRGFNNKGRMRVGGR